MLASKCGFLCKARGKLTVLRMYAFEWKADSAVRLVCVCSWLRLLNDSCVGVLIPAATVGTTYTQHEQP